MASLCLCEPGVGGDLLGERCDAITASRGGGCGFCRLRREGLRETPRLEGLASRDGPRRTRRVGLRAPTSGLGLGLLSEFGPNGGRRFRARRFEPNDLGSVCHGLGAVRDRGLLAFARASAAAFSAAATAARRASAFFSSVADVTDPVSPRM